MKKRVAKFSPAATRLPKCPTCIQGFDEITGGGLHPHIERPEVHESGDYDLEGLFVRLGHAIDSIGARRVVLEGQEVLFAGLPNEILLRAEMQRLFPWLKAKGVAAAITAERGRDNLTRHGLEEYVSDCVIPLDHRVTDQIATRYMRVVKYRGVLHGTNEFPFPMGSERAASGILRQADAKVSSK